MPTYAYRCTECGHAFDIYQSFTEDSLTVCPECSGKLRKVLSPVGVVFKGSGFYRNDSRSATTTSESASPSKDSGPSSSATKDGGSAPATKDSGAGSSSTSGSGSISSSSTPTKPASGGSSGGSKAASR